MLTCAYITEYIVVHKRLLLLLLHFPIRRSYVSMYTHCSCSTLVVLFNVVIQKRARSGNSHQIIFAYTITKIRMNL
jgi:hypothetical protein